MRKLEGCTVAGQRRKPRAVKANRCFDVAELAAQLGVHRNTIRAWLGKGLKPLADGRPIMFTSAAVNVFLSSRKAAQRVKCPPGTIYCLKCRAARRPAGGLVEIIAINAASGNLKGICETCGTTMHRRVPIASIVAIMPGINVQSTGQRARLIGCSHSPLNCDEKRKAK
jgi:hypothetical protein